MTCARGKYLRPVADSLTHEINRLGAGMVAAIRKSRCTSHSQDKDPDLCGHRCVKPADHPGPHEAGWDEQVGERTYHNELSWHDPECDHEVWPL